MIIAHEDLAKSGGPASSPLPHLVRGFGGNGWVNRYPGLTPRPQQEIMARHVAEALQADQPLLFEAGTGVGKSLVYLLNSILHAVSSERKGVISTHTIALQEQLRRKDIPLCREILRSNPETAAYADFKVAFLVGRGNYLCPNRLASALSNQTELFISSEQEELQSIHKQLRELHEGLRSEIRPSPSMEVWDSINADSSTCSRKRCSPDNCYYQKAKAIVQSADLVLVNHSLLFSLIQAGAAPREGRGILFPNDFVILDEAHTIPDIATDHFGLHLSNHGIERLLKGLYHSRRKKGLFLKYGSTDDMKAVEQALYISDEFFEGLRQKFFQTRNWQRVREPDLCENTLTPILRRVLYHLERVMDAVEMGAAREEIQDQRNRLHSMIVSLEEFLKGEEENTVHWIEQSGKKNQNITFRTAPLNIAPYLRASLFQREVSVVMTSATLSLGDEMANFRERSGSQSIEAGIVNSPFPYQQNLRIFAANDPLPRNQENRLDRQLVADYVKSIAPVGNGGTLVLFTSYADLFGVANLLEGMPELRRFPILRQEVGVSRSQLLETFKDSAGSILLGTESFWTGIDLPGLALTKLIIPKLPFRNPQQPVPQARQEWLIERGKHPFQDWSLPEALLQFRQGIGRLIRTMDDKGALFLLDSRILHKTYGKRFLEVLPHQQIVKGNLDSLFKSLNNWQPIL